MMERSCLGTVTYIDGGRLSTPDADFKQRGSWRGIPLVECTTKKGAIDLFWYAKKKIFVFHLRDLMGQCPRPMRINVKRSGVNHVVV